MKKKTGHTSEEGRSAVLSRREVRFDSQLGLDPERLVFIGETWTATSMNRSPGGCCKGELWRTSFPHELARQPALVAGLRMTGMVVPTILHSPIKGEWFEAFVGMSCPGLRPSNFVVLDNLSNPKRTGAREMIKADGALLFVLPYSSDFNLIGGRAKLKALFRKAGERTVLGLWDLTAGLSTS